MNPTHLNIGSYHVKVCDDHRCVHHRVLGNAAAEGVATGMRDYTQPASFGVRAPSEMFVTMEEIHKADSYVPAISLHPPPADRLYSPKW
jgi:hypothetical protein